MSTTYVNTNTKLTVVEKVQFFISLFGVIATIAAASAALMSAKAAKQSVEEQGENNKRAVMPFLVTDNLAYDVKFHLDKQYFLLNWDNGKYDLSSMVNISVPELELINISKGTAKNITVNMEIEYTDEFISDLLGIEDERIKLFIAEDPLNEDLKNLYLNEFIVNKGKSVPSFAGEYKLSNFRKQDLVFIGPDGDSKKIEIPDTFVVLYNLFFCNLRFKTNLDSLPKLKILINYEDIINNRYENSYRLSINKLSTDYSSSDFTAKFSFDLKKA